MSGTKFSVKTAKIGIVVFNECVDYRSSILASVETGILTLAIGELMLALSKVPVIINFAQYGSPALAIIT